MLRPLEQPSANQLIAKQGNEMSSDIEEKLIVALSKVLLNENEPVDGLDCDLVAYISGMMASKVSEDDHQLDQSFLQESVDEVLIPFLDSVQCPDQLVKDAESVVLTVLKQAINTTNPASGSSGGSGPYSSSSSSSTARKLTQGVVSMSSDLNRQAGHEEEASKFLWGADQGMKAMANNVIDAYADKLSSKEKRKARQIDVEKARKALSSTKDEDIDTAGGLVRMNYRVLTGNSATDKSRDVQVKNVSVSLDNGNVLLESSDLKFAYQRRYGLIGENGVGKSTLLKAMSRPDSIDGFPKHLRVLHVRQEVPSHISLSMTVTQAVLESDVERNTLVQEEKDIMARLEQTEDESQSTLSYEEKRKLLAQKNLEGKENMSSITNDLKKLDEIYARLASLSSESAESRAAAILSGLQFSPQMQISPLASLSGGWKMRVALAAALFIAPDLLMLDEPTNHLEAVLWLESYLVDYKHTLIVVSHDRGFLNAVCTDIMEFKRRKLTYYRGNYDSYVKQRDEQIKNQQRLYEAYKSKRDHMMEFIDKFRANAKRASMVQSRIKAVDKMDAEAPQPVEVDLLWRFAIPSAVPVSPPIIAVNDVYFDFKPVNEDGSTKKPENEYLLQKVNFGVDLASRIAILGANGAGKSTLLNLIMGRLNPIKGSVSINTSLRIGHFTQHSSDNFDLQISAVENLMDMFDAEDQVIRSFLGRFQIQGNDALKPMMLLSGGQKSRVAFAALAYKQPHVLVIDEGTNHLSMDAVDALVEAVQDFKGGLVVVSHDQFFVSKTCTELWVVHEGQATRFRGDFDEYKKRTAELTQKRVEESIKRMGTISS